MSKIGTNYKDINKEKYKNNVDSFNRLISNLNDLSKKIDNGGGKIAIERQHSKGRLTARDRIKNLIDGDTVFFELGKFAAHGMYEEYGEIPAAGIIAGLGIINNQECMIIANDATVKAGAYFEVTLKKTPEKANSR